MYNVYLIYKNIKLATQVTNLKDCAYSARQRPKGVERKNVELQRIGILCSGSDFLITKPGFF